MHVVIEKGKVAGTKRWVSGVFGMRTMQKWAWTSYDNFRRYTIDGLIGF